MPQDPDAVRAALCAEISVDFLCEHDAQDRPAFELDIVPQIEELLKRLRALDARRLSARPDTSYLFAVHALEVANDLETLARFVGAPESVATGLYYLGLVHDVGKLFLPPAIWETSTAKPSGLFKALRRTHAPLGAAFLSANPDFLSTPYIAEDILPFFRGEKSISGLGPPDLAHRIPDRIPFEEILEAVVNSPFRGHQTAFLPLALTAALRHHEKTGTEGPKDQPVWLKCLALLEDLSGNMVERPHFVAAGRGTSLPEAVQHMYEDGLNTHDLGLLSLIRRAKEQGCPFGIGPGDSPRP
ncbi:MAG TPA: hypothetical protein PKX87_00050 [Alphaproteobacteria bacterium]|nr:hypothetical protein [Alphaproteobacteria bacterium]